ncbi:MAG: hypothetical protein JW861_02595 [Bacteroidales bacterium]|nr:hypothetical protein [Bacteroidales bacterium]
MKKSVFNLTDAFLVLMIVFQSSGQNISVSEDSSHVADPSAILDVHSTSKGLLIPRMTELERDAIQVPATGLLIFQTDGIPGLYLNEGDANNPSWISLVSYSGQVWQRDTLRRHVFLPDASDSVGVGIRHPEEKLEINGHLVIDTLDPFLRFNQDSFPAGRIRYYLPPDNGYLHFQSWDMNNFEATGIVLRSPFQRVGIGTLDPATRLDVAGTVKMTGFLMPGGAGEGNVLTSDQDGYGTWTSPPIKGSGSAEYIPKFNEPRNLVNSSLREIIYTQSQDPQIPPDSSAVHLFLYRPEIWSSTLGLSNDSAGAVPGSGLELGFGLKSGIRDAYLLNMACGNLHLGTDSINRIRIDTAAYISFKGDLVLDSADACVMWVDTFFIEPPQERTFAEARLVKELGNYPYETDRYFHLHSWTENYQEFYDTGIILRPPFNFVGLGTKWPEKKLEIEGNMMLDTVNAAIFFADRNFPQGYPDDIARIAYERNPPNTPFKILHLQAWDGFNMEEPGLVVKSDNEYTGVGLLNPLARLHVFQDDFDDAFRVDDEYSDDTPFVIDREGDVHLGGDVYSDHDLTIDAGNRKITILSGNSKIILENGNITIESSHNLNIHAGNNIVVDAGGSIQFSADMDLDLQAGNQCRTSAGIKIKHNVSNSSVLIDAVKVAMQGSPYVHLNGPGRMVSGMNHLVSSPAGGGLGPIIQGNPFVLMGLDTEGDKDQNDPER